MHRRDAMLDLGRLSLGSLALPALLRAEKASAQERPTLRTPGAGKAKQGILIFLWGGPPQMDMFDVKPDAPEGIRSHFKPIPTNVSGIQLSEMMPLTAKQADKYTVVRSFSHGSDNHEVSIYHTLTGHYDPNMVVPKHYRQRTQAPCPGAVLSCLAPSRDVPSAVTLPRPVMYDGIKFSGTYAGWMGPQYDPVELPDRMQKASFPSPVLDFEQAGGVEMSRLVRRKGMLNSLEALDRSLQAAPPVTTADAFRERAFSLLTSGKAKQAFDLSTESPAVRDRYGRNHYGESFLLARRLIEAGTRLVTLNWLLFFPDGKTLNPWDNHGGSSLLGGITGYEMLKRDYAIPPLDRAYAALLADLADRGMLAETAVVLMGEFGRTPKINAQVGRDHWGACQSILLAGGGFKGGALYGSSDAHAAYPADNPVSPPDLLATLYAAFGFPPETTIHDVSNRPHPVSEGQPVAGLFG